MPKLPRAFYTGPDVDAIARALLGKTLLTRIGGRLTGGTIVETEAYAGCADRASHAFGGRRTRRTEVMYRMGGTAYVYLCYGMHALFNVVTNRPGEPHAVLVRAIEPTVGVSHMLRRRRRAHLDRTLAAGPGMLTAALGIRVAHSGIDLTGTTLWIEDRGVTPHARDMIAAPRIGVAYAGPHAALPRRFLIRGSPFVSRNP
jgi:DNA-3-methyladenine glycosylase